MIRHLLFVFLIICFLGVLMYGFWTWKESSTMTDTESGVKTMLGDEYWDYLLIKGTVLKPPYKDTELGVYFVDVVVGYNKKITLKCLLGTEEENIFLKIPNDDQTGNRINIVSVESLKDKLESDMNVLLKVVLPKKYSGYNECNTSKCQLIKNYVSEEQGFLIFPFNVNNLGSYKNVGPIIQIDI